MATLVENAIRIKQTFDDICDAIIEKGASPSGGVDTYAEAISEIPAQVTVTPENCPFKLVFSSFAQTNSSQVNFNSTEVLDENYFVVSDSVHWRCVKKGRYLIFLSVGAHAASLPSSYTAKTQFYLNNRFITSASITTSGGKYVYTISDLSVADTLLGNVSTSATGYSVSGRICIYYWGEK